MNLACSCRSFNAKQVAGKFSWDFSSYAQKIFKGTTFVNRAQSLKQQLWRIRNSVSEATIAFFCLAICFLYIPFNTQRSKRAKEGWGKWLAGGDLAQAFVWPSTGICLLFIWLFLSLSVFSATCISLRFGNYALSELFSWSSSWCLVILLGLLWGRWLVCTLLFFERERI